MKNPSHIKFSIFYTASERFGICRVGKVNDKGVTRDLILVVNPVPQPFRE